MERVVSDQGPQKTPSTPELPGTLYISGHSMPQTREFWAEPEASLQVPAVQLQGIKVIFLGF